MIDLNDVLMIDLNIDFKHIKGRFFNPETAQLGAYLCDVRNNISCLLRYFDPESNLVSVT